MRLFSKISIKSKLMLTYIILIIIPTLVNGAFIYKQLLESFANKSFVLIDQRLKHELENIKNDLQNIEMLGYRMSSSTTIIDFLNQIPKYSIVDFYKNYNYKINPIFSYFLNTNSGVSNINILVSDPEVPEVSVFIRTKEFEQESWFQNVKSNVHIGSPYWEGYHPSRNYRNIDSKNRHVYSLFFEINSYRSSNPAYLELEINAKKLFSGLSASPIGKNGFLAAITEDGEIISGESNNILPYLVKDNDFWSHLNSSTDNFTFSWQKTEYNINYVKIDSIKTYIISVIPSIEITELLQKPKNNFLYTVAITLFILILLAYYFGKVFTTKINRIGKAVYQVQEGIFDIDIPVQGEDELDKLSKSINIMASKIKDLINKVYKSQIAQQQAELFALQAQIKPHFIYNALETLKMMAELHDENEISEGLTALGTLLRRDNSIGNHLIPIKAEVEYLEDYLKIHKLLRDNTISYAIKLDKELEECKILGLTLQPIVENCILHGFDETINKLNVNVLIKKEGTDLVCIVQDDGVGIHPEKLQYIRENLQKSQNSLDANESIRGIGLNNVERRIKLFFGSSYGISIDSIYQKETTVILKLPILV